MPSQQSASDIVFIKNIMSIPNLLSFISSATINKLMHPQVVLLFENMTHIQNIIGEDNMGSYFGYALAAGDIDNDGLDDLIVGAPMFTVPDNSEMNFETGRIYVYYGKGPNKYTEYVKRFVDFIFRKNY